MLRELCTALRQLSDRPFYQIAKSPRYLPGLLPASIFQTEQNRTRLQNWGYKNLNILPGKRLGLRCEPARQTSCESVRQFPDRRLPSTLFCPDAQLMLPRYSGEREKLYIKANEERECMKIIFQTCLGLHNNNRAMIQVALNMGKPDKDKGTTSINV